MDLWNYIKSHMLKHTEQIVYDENDTYTYHDIIMEAERLAKRLSEEKCCGIMCSSELKAGIALLGCFAAKVTALPLTVRYGRQHSDKIIDAITPTAIISDNNGVVITKSQKSSYVCPSPQPAVIMCTSGTTGIPKGAMLTEENIITNASDISVYFNVDSKDSILITRPIYHCAVMTSEFLVSLLKGLKIRFYSGAFNPQKTLEIMDKEHITVFCSTPTVAFLLAKFKKNTSNSSIKTMCISGECVGDGVEKALTKAFPDTKVYVLYGLTEACPRVSYLPPDLFNEYSDCVGYPLKSVEVKILKDNKEVAPGEEGVVWVKGKNIMIGYYNAPEQTKRVLNDGWLCTGDIGFINDIGLLKIKGRADEMIIRAGMNIYPQEIENALKKDVRVREVLVKGEKESGMGTKIVLTIAGQFQDSNEVRELCKAVLPAYQIPQKIILLDELPKTVSGKVLRR